jgi:hypothetical protein
VVLESVLTRIEEEECHTPEIMNRIRGAKIPPRTHDETCVRKAK